MEEVGLVPELITHLSLTNAAHLWTGHIETALSDARYPPEAAHALPTGSRIIAVNEVKEPQTLHREWDNPLASLAGPHALASLPRDRREVPR